MCALLLQYILHLPISYLTKPWFWHTPSGANTIDIVARDIPHNAAIATQNNITPHFSHRDYIFTLWPEKKIFSKDSPCHNSTCDWFRLTGSPKYLIVDISSDWDIRHFLTSREEFIHGLTNLEAVGVIKKDKQLGTSILYKVLK
jgi:hypothetical protein